MKLAKPALVLVAALALAGCSTPAPTPTETAAADTLSGTVTVFAAASLTDSFQAIADAFTAEHPDVTVTFNFGGSSGLATQIVEAAPADVFAAASPATMQTVTDAALTDGDPTDFATNVLEIAVAKGNPGGITGLEDFANADKTIALCAVEVPCGAAAAKLFDAAGIVPSVDTYEQDVKAVLTKVELGEVDAGVVYVTDVLDAGNAIEGIEVDSAPVAYPIATLSASTNKEAAQAFVDFVLSDKGQSILKAAGFGTP
ncbi:molybdate ABC transporter substrate-binding protein [soil metagenome]